MTVDVTEVGLAPLPYSVQGEKLMHQAVLYTAVAQDLANDNRLRLGRTKIRRVEKKITRQNEEQCRAIWQKEKQE